MRHLRKNLPLSTALLFFSITIVNISAHTIVSHISASAYLILFGWHVHVFVKFSFRNTRMKIQLGRKRIVSLSSCVRVDFVFRFSLQKAQETDIQIRDTIFLVYLSSPFFLWWTMLIPLSRVRSDGFTSYKNKNETDLVNKDNEVNFFTMIMFLWKCDKIGWFYFEMNTKATIIKDWQKLNRIDVDFLDVLAYTLVKISWN